MRQALSESDNTERKEKLSPEYVVNDLPEKRIGVIKLSAATATYSFKGEDRHRICTISDDHEFRKSVLRSFS